VVHYLIYKQLIHKSDIIVRDKLLYEIAKEGELFTCEGIHLLKNILMAIQNNNTPISNDVLRLLMKKCAIMYSSELHYVVQCIKGLNQDVWNQVIVGVCGPPSPRVGHSAMQYFERLIGNSSEQVSSEFKPQIPIEEAQAKCNRKLYYLENVDVLSKALDIIGQLELEREKYDTFLSMKTDILAYDSKAYLTKVCNK
jgi:hypothetical protein